MAKEVKQHNMMVNKQAIAGIIACAMLCGMNDAFGVFTEPFAEDSVAVRNTPVLDFRQGNSNFRGADVQIMLGAAETGINIDLLSESGNRNGWGVLGDDVPLFLEKDRPGSVLDALALGNGSPAEPAWDAVSWIDRVLDVGGTNANLSSAWGLGGLPDASMNAGLNNIYRDNIAAIPEPATYGLITIFGGGLLLFRRRFKA